MTMRLEPSEISPELLSQFSIDPHLIEKYRLPENFSKLSAFAYDLMRGGRFLDLDNDKDLLTVIQLIENSSDREQ